MILNFYKQPKQITINPKYGGFVNQGNIPNKKIRSDERFKL